MLRVREIMTTAVASVAPDTPVRDAIELLATRHLSGAPVLSGGRIVGVVSATDLMAFLTQLPRVPTERPVLEEYEDDNIEIGAALDWDLLLGAAPDWDLLAEHDVSEVMTRMPLHTVLPDDSAEHAARVMQDEGIHRVLVVEDERLVGIVSALDITKAAGDHRFSTRTYVFNHDRDFGDRAGDS